MSLRVEDVGVARVLTFARPEKKNALSSAAISALVAAIDDAGRDATVRGVVLAADGDVWAAGGDLAELAAYLDDEKGADRVLAMGERLGAVEDCPVPVVAAVTGHVFGGGCELLLRCDAAFAEDGATLAFRHAAMGLAPAWGGACRLVERVGPGIAFELLATAEPLDAERAARLGLVNERVGEGEALAAALAFIGRAARHARVAVEAQKRALGAVRRAARGDAEAAEAEIFRTMWGSAPHRAAMAAFERRARG